MLPAASCAMAGAFAGTSRAAMVHDPGENDFAAKLHHRILLSLLLGFRLDAGSSEGRGLACTFGVAQAGLPLIWQPPPSSEPLTGTWFFSYGKAKRI